LFFKLLNFLGKSKTEIASVDEGRVMQDDTKFKSSSKSANVVPKFTKTLKPISLNVNQNVALETNFVAFPEPKVVWLFENQIIDFNQSKNYKLSEPTQGLSRLEIINAGQEHSGNYTCKIINKLGSATSSATVLVKGMI
jgi:CRE-UNC-89 protein